MEKIILSLKSFRRVVLMQHNPRNVIMWIWHRIVNSSVVVCVYRRLMLPFVVRCVCKQKKIRVVFLPMNTAMWRYGRVYQRMLEDERFEPVIVTAPRIIQPKESYVKEQNSMLQFFKGLGCEVSAGYDVDDGVWNKLEQWNPDVIFYTQPYEGMLPNSYEHWHNLKSLVCYTPYSFQLSKAGWNWDNSIQNYAWRHYVSLPYHVRTCHEYSRIKGVNAVPVGYFFEEEYQDALADRALLDKTWRDDKRKRVIWAPHHSIATGAEFKTSAFLEICDEMVRLREKYRDEIVFAFKPHPMLRDNLHQRWGKERTEAYYADWANAENSFLDDGAFIPLFAGSDAMIHCSGSFIVDYIYTGKPVQYVYCKDRNAPDFGEIGDAALKAHYPAHGVDEIEQFIENVVLAGDDPMKKQREDVYQKYLKSPNGKTFSENVVEDILAGLGRSEMK